MSVSRPLTEEEKKFLNVQCDTTIGNLVEINTNVQRITEVAKESCERKEEYERTRWKK